MIDYVIEFGKNSFIDEPLNDIDAVVLSQLAYMDFAYLQTEKITSIAQMNERQIQTVIENTWRANQNAELLRVMQRSVRFGSLNWHDWVERQDIEAEEQFSAVTFALLTNLSFIAYRGTTATLTDWKEDFNLTFMPEIPSQQAALKYYQKMHRHYPGKYYLGGHSKGGNLAVYTLVHSHASRREDILAAYSVDGPGLNETIPDYCIDRVHKLIPEASVIGLLLEPESSYQVVQSDSFGFNQHDPHSWATRGPEFVLATSTTSLSKYTQASITRWLESIDDATRGEFLNSIFDLFEATDDDRLSELAKNWPVNFRIMMKAISDSNPETRQRWKDVTDKLFGAMTDEAKLRVTSRWQQSIASMPKLNVPQPSKLLIEKLKQTENKKSQKYF